MQEAKYCEMLVGIDEAGRGPLAGPVAVAAVAFRGTPESQKAVRATFRKIKDSKKLSREKRERWFQKMVGARERGHIDFAVSLVGPEVIDQTSIVYAINIAISRILKRLALPPEKTSILLDGSLHAPNIYRHQETIVKGDEKRKIIAMASVVAKVSRDQKMIRYAKEFEQYGFDSHKGYGTRAHYAAIRKYGLCKIHRRTFLTDRDGQWR